MSDKYCWWCNQQLELDFRRIMINESAVDVHFQCVVSARDGMEDEPDGNHSDLRKQR